MDANRTRGYLVIAAAIVVAAVLISVTIITAMQGIQTTTTTTTLTTNSSSTVTYFFGQNVTMQIPNLSSIPSSFVVGAYLLTINQPAECTAGQCSLIHTITFEVTGYCAPGLNCQLEQTNNVTFSWSNGFSQSLPSPTNSSLYKHNLTMDWTIQSGDLFLTVSEFVPTIVSYGTTSTSYGAG